MGGLIDKLKGFYIRFMVFLGAEPPTGYEHLIGKQPQPAPKKEPPPPAKEVAPQPGPPVEAVAPQPPAEAVAPQPEPPVEAVAPQPEPPVEAIAPQPEPPAAVEEAKPEAEEQPAPTPDAGWLEAAPPEAAVEAPAQLPLTPEAPAATEAEAPAEPLLFRYEVQRGDTLNSVARHFGLTVKDLLEANQLEDPGRIYPGQKLVIPGYTLPSPELEPPPQPVMRPAPADVGDQFVYTVAGGDTLNTIARRYGITLVELIEANTLGDPPRIFVGQKLVIPGVFRQPPEQPRLKTTPDFPPSGPLDAVRGAYASYFALGHADTRAEILGLLASRELNALVIDAKSDHGWLSFPTNNPLALEIGANRPATVDALDFVSQAKAQGVYLIARIVVFKDDPLARARPELAVKTRTGTLWLDSNDLGWTDPFAAEVWDYNIQLAAEAALLGFDEIQFDFVRFPTGSPAGEPVFSQPVTKESRVAAITGFLSAARGQLHPRRVTLSARVLGYTCWRQDDFVIGQQLERMATYLDVICPMLSPSTFDKGIPGFKVAVAHPYEVVHNSAKIAVRRTAATNCQVRPWLQDFQDYRFDRRQFGQAEIQAQIKGGFDAGCSGYMVWNPGGKYTLDAYAPVSAG
ncbi:MAG: hypothetical protein Kow0031_05440 [Anaerolineae bacterium]